MTAKNKQELADAIDSILNPTSEPVDNAEKGVELRKRVAESLANEIDAYIQYQIGIRLSRINFAINATDSTGNPVPTTPGPEFNTFTRIT
jgi:hypothetical protein